MRNLGIRRREMRMRIRRTKIRRIRRKNLGIRRREMRMKGER